MRRSGAAGLFFVSRTREAPPLLGNSRVCGAANGANCQITTTRKQNMMGWCSSRSHTHLRSLSEPPPRVFGYPVKQLEWADSTEGCLCSWFPLHFEVFPGSRGLAPARVWALCREGRGAHRRRPRTWCRLRGRMVVPKSHGSRRTFASSSLQNR